MCADADLKLAAANIVKGGFSYSGQRCTAVKVVLADKTVGLRLFWQSRSCFSSTVSGLTARACLDINVPVLAACACLGISCLFWHPPAWFGPCLQCF